MIPPPLCSPRKHARITRNVCGGPINPHSAQILQRGPPEGIINGSNRVSMREPSRSLRQAVVVKYVGRFEHGVVYAPRHSVPKCHVPTHCVDRRCDRRYGMREPICESGNDVSNVTITRAPRNTTVLTRGRTESAAHGEHETAERRHDLVEPVAGRTTR